eukprot:scaffold3307_cov371-Prasinococcus_capsulatus_cf.AAC.3
MPSRRRRRGGIRCRLLLFRGWACAQRKLSTTITPIVWETVDLTEAQRDGSACSDAGPPPYM